ncbi:T3SS effector HopA1 family protein [Nostoc sp.]|uniref:T3SS effector HopA1 family protein n=1 Tax=Nostoc sp. TaxID=1180 RepID=UPI002FF5F514
MFSPEIQNLISKIKINSTDFSINHPNYLPENLPDNIIKKISILPEEIQNNYLKILLINFVFGIYSNGTRILEKSHSLKTDYAFSLENIYSGIDWEFCEKLQKNNHGRGWWNPNYRVLRQEADGTLALQKLGITVHIQRNRHLRLEEQLAMLGDLVSIFTPPEQITNQLYAAYGDFIVTFSNSVAIIYFNFSSEGAVAVMRDLTVRLNALKVPFIFYVLNNPSNYKRYDSGFLRFNKDSYVLVRQVLQTVYVKNESHFQAQVPIFTKVLAPGLSLAETPESELEFIDNFGRNLCQIIANALLEAHKNGDESKEARMKYILKHFDHFKIDLERPYLNPDSEDIYTPLD